jgi:hypothetical protein
LRHHTAAGPLPDPRNHALLSFTLYRRGRWDAYLLNEYPATQCETASDRPLIRIAQSSAEWLPTDNGRPTTDHRPPTTDHPPAPGWSVVRRPSSVVQDPSRPDPTAPTPKAQGPRPNTQPRFRLRVADTLLGGGTIDGEIDFVPLYIPHSPAVGTAGPGDHTWVLAAPTCRVHGAMEIRRPAGARTLTFRGMGYHDHNYGVEDFTVAMRAWSWGRVHTPEDTLVYYDVAPRGSHALTRRLIHLEHETGAVRMLDGTLAGHGWRPNAFLLSSPGAIRWRGSGGGVTLSGAARPRTIVDPGPFYLRFLSDFDVTLEQDGVIHRHRGPGFAEYLQPARLDWRWTWPMLKTRFLRTEP